MGLLTQFSQNSHREITEVPHPRDTQRSDRGPTEVSHTGFVENSHSFYAGVTWILRDLQRTRKGSTEGSQRIYTGLASLVDTRDGVVWR